ncbi:MAG: response regulator [Deltaproteobacteria bacterium]|nr:response regulator [Deltaproteobacteria bacterium]
MGDDRLIGELLVQRGVVSRAAVEEASLAAHAAGQRLCSRLLANRACDERDLVAALATRHGLPGVDLSRTAIELEALQAVPRSVAEGDLVLPLSSEGDRLHLAVDSPARAEQVVAEVRFVTGREVSIYVAVLGALQEAITQAYDAAAQGATVWRGPAAPPGLARIEAVLPAEAPPEAVLVGGDDVEFVSSEPMSDVEIVDTADDEVVATVQVVPGPTRVLVVDDEPAIRLLAQRALQHKGYAVEVAADGQEALDKIRAQPPDLLLLDAMLPKVHGFEVARKVRSDPATRQVPIMIMTAVYRGWRFAEDARQSYGAEDYVEKPFRIDDLLRRVEVVLEATATREAAPQGRAGPALEQGKALLAAGKHGEAVAALEQALHADAFSAEAHWLLGKALTALGDAFRAMSALERAVELRPGHFPALKALAATYLDKGFRNKAAETLERAVHAAPDEATRASLRKELLKLL